MILTRLRRVALIVSTLTAALLPLTELGASASASTAISPRAFGMHYLKTGSPYLVDFGASRIWDMGVSWRDLQPRSAATSAAALARLDGIVNAQRAHGSQPMITLGVTPAWAAHACNHYAYGVNWGIQTCAPKYTGASSAWGNYVRLLAKRYAGKVSYYELWNEPSLRNGYNDSIRTLAKMQATARSILHAYGAQLVSPAIPFTDGSPNNGLRWLDTFLRQPGGKAFDILGLHLYPADAAARGGYGPEWAMWALGQARAVLARNHVTGKPTWNTETNVGRVPAHTTIGGGSRGAAMVARTFLLATENGVARTFWYAADDRSWGGTWLESSTARSLTAAGHAYVTVRKLLVGAHARGCSRTTVGTNKWHYTCRYRLANGKSMLAVWSTGAVFSYHGPRGTQWVGWVSGGGRSANRSTALRIGAAPVYVLGSFKV